MKHLPRYVECFVCGDKGPLPLDVHFLADEKDVHAHVRFKKEYCGYPGRVHGGVVAGVMDEAMGWVCTLHTDLFYYTAHLEMRYKKAVLPEEEFHVHAQMLWDKGRLAAARSELLDAEGEVLVSAEGKFVPLDKEQSQAIWNRLEMRDC